MNTLLNTVRRHGCMIAVAAFSLVSTAPSAEGIQPINLSTRMFVQTGDNVGIGGFIITGRDPKQVMLRAIGPSLAGSGVPNVLPDPLLELHGSGGFVTITNNNWRDDQEQEIIDTGIPPTNDFESAIVATLDPGNYTGIVRGNDSTTGIALIEVYDLDQAADSKLANISTRAFVQTGDGIVIAGFILGNGATDTVVILRGIGPSLSPGVPDVLADPNLELRDGNGALLAANDNWQDGPPLPDLEPPHPLESAIARTLSPGLYSALLSGMNGGTGNALIEVYDLGEEPVPSPIPGITPTPTPPGITPTPTPPGITPTPTPPGITPTPTPPAATPTPSPAVDCVENFDGSSSLPSGWTATIADGPPPGWAISTTSSDSAPNNAFVPNTSSISDKRLTSRPIAINSATAQVSFRNNYSFEFSMGTYWDGGVLEVSVAGGPFLDIIDPAIGGSFVSGGYNGVIDDSANNPLATQQAWGANTAGAYINSVVNLGPNVGGQSIVLRFRMGTDDAQGAPGWRIDTLVVTGGSCPP